MDLSQIKLSKAEWESIESPVEENEKIILKLIIDGSSNVNIKINPPVPTNNIVAKTQEQIFEEQAYINEHREYFKF